MSAPKKGKSATRTAKASVPDVEFSTEAKDAYIEYGVYTNSRIVPDVRDGLKTGGRRTLWAIYKANAVPGKPTRKCALLVGQAMAYHPHGDSGIYDGLVTMTHEPTDGDPVRKLVPMIHGQGGWGDLDNPASAARYTEARLNDKAMMMLGMSEEILGEGEAPEIAEDSVRLVKNYTGELDEPAVLPALWPQFVINGAEGIGVGVASNVPGHHPVEALDLALALVDTDNPRLSTIMKLLPGPDLPADCDIYDDNGGIESYITTGKGRFMMRARYEIITTPGRRKGKTMVVTGLPWRSSPAKVIAGINELVSEEKLPPLVTRNLSNAAGMRLEIDLGAGDADAIVNQLLHLGSKTRLQEAFNVNSWAIVDSQVQRVSIVDALRHWVAHRRTAIRRRTQFRLDKAEQRHEIVVGLLKAVPVAHLIVETVRASDNRTKAAEAMIKKWKFTERQAHAILDMNVGQLSKLGVDRYEEERIYLEARIEECRKILSDPKELSARLKEEIRATKKYFSKQRRRCRLMEGSARVERPKAAVALVPAKKVVLARTSGWMLRQVAKRNISPVVDMDHVVGFIETTSHDFVDVVTNRGKLTRIKASSVPDKATRADALVDVDVGERAVFAGSTPGGADVILVSQKGLLKRAGAEDNAKMRVGRGYAVQPFTDADDDSTGWAFHAPPLGKCAGKRFMAVTARGYVLAVDATEEVFRAKSRSSKGNPLINLTKDDELIWVGLVDKNTDVVAWTQAGGTFTFRASQIETLNRAVKGTLVCHHKSPIVGAVAGEGSSLMLYHPTMDEAQKVPLKSLTTGTEIKRPTVREGITEEGTIAWIADGAPTDESGDTE